MNKNCIVLFFLLLALFFFNSCSSSNYAWKHKRTGEIVSLSRYDELWKLCGEVKNEGLTPYQECKSSFGLDTWHDDHEKVNLNN